MEVYHAELRRRLRVAEGGRAARAEGGVYAALPAVPALLAGKDVLITGASGFLGRVLLEKLLRSCPDVGAVFLLLRAKKGVPPRERLADIVGVPVRSAKRDDECAPERADLFSREKRISPSL